MVPSPYPTAISGNPAPPSVRRWQLWIAVAAFILSLPAVTVRIYASDEIEYFAYLRSAWFDADLSFENEYRYFYERGIAKSPGFHETFLERTTETGRRINFAPVGCALLWAPFYAVADVAARAARAAGMDVAVDGYSYPYLAAVCYGSALYGFLALLIAWRFAAELVGDGLVSALVVWIGTPLLFYTHVAPPMSHACSAFAVALFLYVWLKVRRSWSVPGCAALGALAALMGMVREQDVLFAAGPGVDFLLSHWRVDSGTRRPEAARRWLAVAAAAGGFALAYVPQALAYLALNGRIGPSRLVQRKMSWTSPHALEVLFSPSHGLVFWTPLVLAGVAGLTLLALRPAARAPSDTARRVAALGLVMVALQIYIAGSVESWTVAGAFGQRRFVSLTPLLVLGFAVLVTAARSRARVWALGAVTVAGVWWNLGLMLQFGAGWMDRQRLEPGKNAYNTFVVLPARAPALVGRYLFDRQSFYQPPR